MLHVLVDREVVAAELYVVEQAVSVEEERITAPTREEAVFAGPVNRCVVSDSNWYLLNGGRAIAGSLGWVSSSEDRKQRLKHRSATASSLLST
jgi:hypothetical protein